MDLHRILASMTLDEKIGQLNQLEYACFDPESKDSATGPVKRLGIDDDQIGAVGTVLNAKTIEQKAMVDEAVREKGGKLPLLHMLDIIHGYRTIYPINLGMAASFDTALAEECASMAALEATTENIHVTFAPMADLGRDARWGRVMEGSGEDPYLNAQMTKAAVYGYQGRPTADGRIPEGKIAACVKHFAAYGAAEAGRDYNTVDMSRRTLFEYYLSGYKAAVDAGVKMAMTAFNVFDGVPATGNSYLMKDVLRGKLGFKGVLISDHTAVNEISRHGCAEDGKEVARMALDATVDIDMMSTDYAKHLKTLLKEGRISIKQIDEAVLRVLELKESLGVFDVPVKYADYSVYNKVVLCPKHREIARKAARESAVLLKNDGILPFSPASRKVAVIGPLADSPAIIGVWAARGRREDTVTILQGIRNALPDAEVAFSPGCPMQVAVGKVDEDPDYIVKAPMTGAFVSDMAEPLLADAVAKAKDADCVVLCLGEWAKDAGESKSKTDLELPYVQYRLLDEVMKANPNTAVVLLTGRPLALERLDAKARAVLNMWMPGTEGGNAAADLLFGKASPSGRLPVSFPYRTGQCPLYYNHYSTGRPRPDEDSFKIYTSSYLDSPNKALYPFGYGLGYTSFQYSDASVSSSVMHRGETIKVSCDVTNTGSVQAKETVQLYVADLFGSAVRPVRELKGFEKIDLMPGETRHVEFEISEDTLAFYNPSLERKAEPGAFHAWIGHDSTTGNMVSFKLV